MNFQRKLIAFATAFFTAISLCAATVASQPGQLAQAITDHSITSLKVTGEMDARDFKFIADNLAQLSELDLSETAIKAYADAENPLFGTDNHFPEAAIPASAFFGMPLTKVVLPVNLQVIGYAAFAGCRNLTEISFPTTLDSIGAYAFSSTALTAVSIPASVRIVGEGAFSRCNSLATAHVASAVIQKDAFAVDTALTTLSLGKEVKTIGDGAFKSCSALTAINFTGSSITSVGEEAFAHTALAVVDLTAQVSLSSVSDWAWANTPVAEAKLPKNLTSLGEGVFFYASELQKAELPASLTSVPAFTFAGATALTTDTIIPAEATEVGNYAFYNASSLNHFVIPQKVQRIGAQAMAGTTGLQTMKVCTSFVPALEDSVWAGVNQPEVKVSLAHPTLTADFRLADQWKNFHILQNFFLGDTNTDGEIDVTDVSLLISYVLSGEATGINLQVADVDQNGNIDVADASLIINMVLTDSKTIIQLHPAGKTVVGNIPSVTNATADIITDAATAGVATLK